MSKVRFLGLDVHADTIAVAVAEPNGEARSIVTIPNRFESVRKLVQKLGPTHNVRACYEAGPTGYVLYWQLTALDEPRKLPADFGRFGLGQGRVHKSIRAFVEFFQFLQRPLPHVELGVVELLDERADALDVERPGRAEVFANHSQCDFWGGKQPAAGDIGGLGVGAGELGPEPAAFGGGRGRLRAA